MGAVGRAGFIVSPCRANEAWGDPSSTTARSFTLYLCCSSVCAVAVGPVAFWGCPPRLGVVAYSMLGPPSPDHASRCLNNNPAGLPTLIHRLRQSAGSISRSQRITLLCQTLDKAGSEHNSHSTSFRGASHRPINPAFCHKPCSWLYYSRGITLKMPDAADSLVK